MGNDSINGLSSGTIVDSKLCALNGDYGFIEDIEYECILEKGSCDKGCSCKVVERFKEYTKVLVEQELLLEDSGRKIPAGEKIQAWTLSNLCWENIACIKERGECTLRAKIK